MVKMTSMALYDEGGYDRCGTLKQIGHVIYELLYVVLRADVLPRGTRSAVLVRLVLSLA